LPTRSKRWFQNILSAGAASVILVSLTCCPFDPTNPFQSTTNDSLDVIHKHVNLIDFRAWSTARERRAASSTERGALDNAGGKKIAYKNPVWNGYFADPFVMQYGNVYYAYGTAEIQGNGRWFPVLRSTDLVHWQELGGALVPLKDPHAVSYWAPEVAQRNGKFYLYYSAGGAAGEHHKIRVAVADKPEGPFIDKGSVNLPDEGFSIDPHPFKDPKSGDWFLFFAKDFFDGRAGTGIAMVRLNNDMMSVKEPIETVVRASADWQIFERNRNWYGKTWDAWHTLEGPTVLFRNGQYYCLYSGGCWNSKNYGVGFAHATDINGPWVDDQDADGASVLAGVPEHVLGPGHNSVTTAPDGVTPVIVYHAWDSAWTARRLCIDQLEWTSKGPRCHPSWQAATLNPGDVAPRAGVQQSSGD